MNFEKILSNLSYHDLLELIKQARKQADVLRRKQKVACACGDMVTRGALPKHKRDNKKHQMYEWVKQRFAHIQDKDERERLFRRDWGEYLWKRIQKRRKRK